MKRTLIYLVIFIAINLYAEKNAKLIIYGDNSKDLKFISTINVVGNDTTYYRNMNFLKDEFIIKNIKKGKYKIKFESIFHDSIITQIEILKKRKIYVKIPDFNIYKKTENIEEFCEKSNKTEKINIYVSTRDGDLKWYNQRIYIDKNNSVYIKQVLDQFDDSNEDVFEVVRSKEIYNDTLKNQINDLIKLSKIKEINCGNFLTEKESHIIILIENVYLEFSFCPEKNNELENIIKTLKDKYIIQNTNLN